MPAIVSMVLVIDALDDAISLQPEPPTQLNSKKTDAKSVFYVLIRAFFQMNAQRLIHTYTFLYTYIFVKPYVFLTCPLWFVTLVALALHLSFTL